MIDVIVVAIIAAVVVAVTVYLIRAKKRGQRCIGCSCCKECRKGSGCASNKGEH